MWHRIWEPDKQVPIRQLRILQQHRQYQGSTPMMEQFYQKRSGEWKYYRWHEWYSNVTKPGIGS